ncbi:thiamine phosphate synthase [Moraxella catarrhalis]|uniref:Thiamin-phosphate pyrophosphorylase n=1 Tax=Moraxella catarrhalis TaxID=480 RepID=A0AB36DN05_MORCA|nr:thiamine phosphate synthase [Moraxella catarrhalis]MPX29359.1 thiamine phosphate synthase [Moraxella catarrhalis]OAV04559.1 Thiamin-phosphate pyrophosphorylase [Moraxella catarrhalis]OAV23555.1 Thiamin-phosphate pyrophosphorylase [Moraxella catarrhalis]RKL88755.1 thiamine phosphate synthase [Moraxella catarrhalis]RKL90348.1 thiamine phosphate synthase [Moraxella catarrhalis]
MTLQSIDKVPKLYLLTNDDELTTLLDKLERVFDTGAVSLLQVRRKSTLKLYDLATVYREAEMIVSLANDYDIKVVMNDNLELASHFGTGLHLGQRDGSVRVAREILGDHVVIGRTCHTDIALFKEAKREGATYGAMGTAFASITKPRAKIISKDILKKACEFDFPLCVIGGITLENIHQLRDELNGAPIDYIAVTADIMGHSVDTIADKCLAWQQKLNTW